MSKSLNNCIFLDDEPNDIFGKVMSISDEVMREWFPLLSDKEPVDADWTIHPMRAKKILANDIVRQLFDVTTANNAQDFFEQTIQSHKTPDEIEIVPAKTVLEAVVTLRKCSKTVARRLISDGAVKINDEKVLSDKDLQNGDIIKVGNRDFGKVK